MEKLIFPDIFDKHIKAFFTTRTVGADLYKISKIFSISHKNIFLPIQKHTSRVLVLESGFDSEIADAVITKKKGILIGVQVADCVPILIYDCRQLVIGSVHAGWRGTASQIIKKTIKSMIEHFSSKPEDIKIAFGPSIKWCCYFVEERVKNLICRATGAGRYYSRRKNGKYCVDISLANKYQAISVGIKPHNIWISNDCTFCKPELYFSYRYVKESNERQGGFIGML